MEINTIVEMAIAVVPSLTAVFAVLGVAFKVLKKFSDLKKEFSEKTDYREMQKTLGKVYEENMELKKEIKMLRTQVDHVRRNTNEEIKSN